jgi:hypothetical protein
MRKMSYLQAASKGVITVATMALKRVEMKVG